MNDGGCKFCAIGTAQHLVILLDKTNFPPQGAITREQRNITYWLLLSLFDPHQTSSINKSDQHQSTTKCKQLTGYCWICLSHTKLPLSSRVISINQPPNIGFVLHSSDFLIATQRVFQTHGESPGPIVVDLQPLLPLSYRNHLSIFLLVILNWLYIVQPPPTT